MNSRGYNPYELNPVESIMLSIRQALPAEWSEVANVTQIANGQYAADADEEWWRNYETNTRTLITTEPTLLRIVALKDDKIVGSVVYTPPYERQMGDKIVRNPFPEMRLLSVLPESRNEGIANALINACETESRKQRADAITLHTTSLMSVAKAMYERRGYVRYPEIDFEPVAGFIVFGYIKRWSSYNERN
jgi:ribosomal protein S18 acetylase RimI-like enzyme